MSEWVDKHTIQSASMNYALASEMDKMRWNASYAMWSFSDAMYNLTKPYTSLTWGVGPAYDFTRGFQGAGFRWLRRQMVGYQKRITASELADICNAYMKLDEKPQSLTLGDLLVSYPILFLGPDWATMAGQEEVL